MPLARGLGDAPATHRPFRRSSARANACALLACVLLGCALLVIPAARTGAAITIEPGWPFTTGYSVSPSATSAELDGTPGLEIAIASQDGKLYVLNHDGTLVPGWPRYMGGALWPDPYANLCSSPAVADLDGDGVPEIVVGCFDGRLHAFEPDGTGYGTFPFTAEFMIFSTPAIGDLDDDPELEIVFGDNHGKIWALNHDRTVVPGFPVATPYVVRSSPALGDLDGDGKDEIVITADNSTFQLYAIDGNGLPLPGFPRYLWMSGAVSSPALGDIDGDGLLDIVAGSRDGRLHAFRADGSYLPGWPLQAGYSIESSPSLADIDGDAGLEIVVGLNDSRVAAYNPDGTLVPGWPVSAAYSVIASPSIGDVDADGQVDVVCPDNTGAVNAWHADGTPVAGFPLHDPTYTVYSSPLLADLDGDGSLELLAGSNDSKIYCWDLGAGTWNPETLPWPEWRRDAANRANAGIGVATSVAGTGGGPAAGAAGAKDVGARLSPNPFTSEASFTLALPPDGGVARLAIYDIAGREVRRFEVGTPSAGAGHASRVVRWDGRDDGGRELAAGLYFYRLECAGRAVASGRAVRVR